MNTRCRRRSGVQRKIHFRSTFSTAIILWALLCLLLVAGGCSPRSAMYEAKEGRLDLSQWDFAPRGMVKLSGQWAFYWNRLLAPEDFERYPLPQKSGFLSIHKLWFDKDNTESYRGPNGTATLRLSLKVGPNTGLMGLELAAMPVAYRMWIDGRLVAEQGRVGGDKAHEEPSFGRKVVFFQPTAPWVTLTLQVSTHNLLGGSLPHPELLLGTQAQLLEKSGKERRQSMMLLGIFLLMAGYHLALFLFYRRDLSTLYFSLYCLMWLVNAAIGYIGTWLMPAIEPMVSARLIYSLDLLSYYLAVPVITLFFRAMFPEEVPARLPKLVLTATVLFILYLLSAQALGWRPLETRLPQCYHLVPLVCIIWSGICLFKALLNRRSGSGLILAGFAVMATVALNDILHDTKLIYTGFFMPYGMLMFIVFQSLALARRFSRAFHTAEALSQELTEKNIALARLDRLKDEFLANTSHEFRTPLSGIIGITESLLAGSAGKLPSTARHNLTMVAGSGRRLAALVNDILDFSRLRNQDLSINLTSVDARALADMVLTLLAPLAREKSLELVNRIPWDLPQVRADENRFQQILYNLLGNAIKFSDQGRITVTGRADGRQAVFEVSDKGMGIPEEKLSEVFEPFKQADSGDGRSCPGTGLGLAITANLVQLHGGKLTVSSTMGKGSVFAFSLALSESPTREKPPGNAETHLLPAAVPALRVAIPPVATELTSRDGADRDEPLQRVLVVDDDPVNQQVLVNLLHLEGLAVEVASDGIQALNLVKKAVPDLVLLDIMMPRVTGYEVCRMLRQKHSASLLPVVMLTAKTRVRDMVEGFACGANDYLSKPFEKDALLSRVRTQLQLKKAYQTLAENIQLKAELTRRKQTELSLRQNQRRLSQLLDTVDDMVVAVNDSFEISFCNRAAAGVLGFDSNALLGQPLDMLFDADWVQTLGERLPLPEKQPAATGVPRAYSCEDLDIHASDGRKIRADMAITAMTVDDDSMHILIIRCAGPKPVAAPDDTAPGKTLALIDEINRHQERLMGLENSLNGLFPQLKNLAPKLEQEIRDLDQALDGIQKNLKSGPAADRRSLAVTVMQIALDYWYEATDLDKAALAMESGIWKTYTDRNGYTRTQTLDKYLDEANLPRQPRWKWVNQTAVYVLSACTTPSPLRDRLEAALAQFRSGD